MRHFVKKTFIYTFISRLTTVDGIKMNEQNQDWNRAELMKFPKLNQYFKMQQKRQQDLSEHLQKVTSEKMKAQIDEKIRKLDVQINLSRILRNDQKYLNIGRNKIEWNFLEPHVMNKILRDAHKIFRSPEHQQQLNSTFCERPKKRKCSRFVRNSNRFENKNFVEANNKNNQQLNTKLKLPPLGNNLKK